MPKMPCELPVSRTMGIYWLSDRAEDEKIIDLIDRIALAAASVMPSYRCPEALHNTINCLPRVIGRQRGSTTPRAAGRCRESHRHV